MTQWTAVLSLKRGGDGDSARAVLAELCQNYWYPLYAFARRLGRSPEDAQDLTQGFFCNVLEQNLFASANPELGRLRTFLLTTFRRHMNDVRDHDTAIKRGGGSEVLSLDVLAGEDKYSWEPADESTPESLYERNWALSVLTTALATLGAHEDAAGRGDDFRAVESFLSPDNAAAEDYAQVAARIGASESTVRQMVSRLRKKFRQTLRDTIAATLTDSDEAQIDEELLALRAALRK
jgi:RNA polymerase sigma factor (sigma-70 family)